MWFIIIFGSIPVLRPFFIRFAQSIKTAAGHPENLTNGPPYLTTSRDPNNTWVQLNGKTHICAAHDSAHGKLSYNFRHGESEEEIMPGPARDQMSINEGSKGLVPSKYGSTNTIVKHLPMEKRLAGRQQEVRKEVSMDRQINVTRDFSITYEDQTDES